MVYCSKCGTLNADNAQVCTNCGATLRGARAESQPCTRRWRWEEEYRGYPRRSGAIAVLVIGLIVVLVGFSLLAEQVYGINIPLGAIFLILFGVFIVFVGLRARRWSQRCYQS